MSQSVNSPVKLLPDSLNGRDKLLKLAEVASSKSSSSKKKSSKFSLNSSKCDKEGGAYDLAFTSNIEHLVNKDFSLRASTPIPLSSEQEPVNTSISHDINSNVSCDSFGECLSHSTSTKDSHLESTSPSDLNIEDLKLYESNSFTSNCEFKSRIPQSVTRRKLENENSLIPGLNRWPHNEDLSTQAMKYHSMRNAAYFSEMPCGLPQSKTSQAINVQKHFMGDSEQTTMVKSRSHNTLHRRSSKEQPLPNQTQPLISSNFPDYFGNFATGLTNASLRRENVESVARDDNTQTVTQSDNIKRFMNRLDSFFVMDEDSFANSPKRIVNQPRSEGQTILKPSLLISTPDQNLYEKHFLIESQKNALFSISTKTEQFGHRHSGRFAKSNSCDGLDYFKIQSASKPKSETDLGGDIPVNEVHPQKESENNDLSGILHLEEETPEEESMFHRFRKSFSLRFSKPPSVITTKESKENVCVKDTTNGLASDSILIISEESSHELNQCDVSDINQNRIYKNKNFEGDSFIGKLSTIERRKSRQDMFNRKSFRRSSRKNIRIKRSHSQPNDKSENSVSPNPDRSIDSDFEGKISPSDDGKSISQLNDSQENNDEVIYAEAIWKYSGEDNEELSFETGDLIDVTDTSHKEWWWGAIKTKDETRYGWFPASYVRLKVSQEETMEEALASEDLESTPKKRMSVSRMSSEQVRANVVLEIINTERDFVKNLRDVVEGYLKPCRDRSDMFDSTRISTIFGNIEELYNFQNNFLSELEQSINWENLSSSQIGNCFLSNEKGFRVYCEFCKNHPLATNELQDLFADHKYIVFFEGCRLLQNMIDISLAGFLLTPIQKICKYPLQLGELLKYTRAEHSDYEPVKNAHGCMQRVAQLVNERKRRFESLEQLITLQGSFENWEGPPLLDLCSLLIHSGEVTRITSSSWSKDVTLMLFDHQLILCKKETGILKKSSYTFKSRIDLDHVDSVVSLEDNTKDIHFNVATKNAFKLYYKLKQKWYLFQAKSPAEKEKWIHSFEEERQRVREDAEQGFFVSEQDKKDALLAHQNQLKPRKPRARRPYAKVKKPDTVIAEIPLADISHLGPVNGFEIDRNRAGSLPSYIYQEKQSLNPYKHRQSTMHKKSRSNWFQLGSNKKNRTLKRNLK